ncbi:UDP-N-acetylmuramate dehydrogenase [Pseudonocardia sp. HH130630-07]|uniref:UDP-N-acetylmuramate dehydrogenase n=1 Tax=Pseudonocardia sp. HH130630-07 TaxID=1690815 RepID=UPI000839CA6F|nr:UDP-N-acetylmuramate dehydrogenase [Pseudonocardia sp. HH130630-07]
MSFPGTTTTDPRLSAHTTLRLGGPAARIVRAEGSAEVVDAVGGADAAGERVLLVGGGSNLVVADTGFDGTAVLLAGRGVAYERAGDSVLVTVEAGEDWDDVVAATVAEGLGGLECLSGIPGRTGATPVQNVGAYGVEVADLLVDVDLYDRRTRTVRTRVPAAELGLAYRTSVLKGTDDAVVLRVRFALRADGRSAPVRYAELARTLGVEPDSRTEPAVVRDAVLALRRGKGMVLDPDDHDTWSAGSFFTNPVLPVADAPVVDGLAAWPAGDGRVKLSAAGLIQQAGFTRGFAGPGGRVALSSRHVLALTHRGGGTTADLLALAAQVRDGVAGRFGVELTAEPVLVGCTL